MVLWEPGSPEESASTETSTPAPDRSWDTTCLLQESLATSARVALCAAPSFGAPADCAVDAVHRFGLGRLACRRVNEPIELALIEAAPLNPDVAPLEEEEEKPVELEEPKQEEDPDERGQTVDIAKPAVEVRPDDAKFLAEYDSKVREEMRTRLPSSLEPSAPSPGKSEESKERQPPQPQPTAPPQEAQPERAPQKGGAGTLAMRTPGEKQKTERGQAAGEVETDEDGTFQKQGENAGEPEAGGPESPGSEGKQASPSLMPTDDDLARSVGSGSVDDLEGIEDGDGTLLNTKRWKYATFFNRVKRSVYKSWAPAVDSAYRLRDPTFKIYGTKNRQTVLMVRLRPDGGLEEIVVVEPSGVGFLDDVAVQAFKKAQPFPNPPGGLVDPESKLITFKFGFRLEITDRPNFKIFRYQ